MISTVFNKNTAKNFHYIKIEFKTWETSAYKLRENIELHRNYPHIVYYRKPYAVN